MFAGSVARSVNCAPSSPEDERTVVMLASNACAMLFVVPLMCSSTRPAESEFTLRPKLFMYALTASTVASVAPNR